MTAMESIDPAARFISSFHNDRLGHQQYQHAAALPTTQGVNAPVRILKVLIFFHVNSGTRAFPPKLLHVQKLLNSHCRAHLLTLDYTEFGDSRLSLFGEPSECSFLSDARAILGEMSRKLEQPMQTGLQSDASHSASRVQLRGAMEMAGGIDTDVVGLSLLRPLSADSRVRSKSLLPRVP